MIEIEQLVTILDQAYDHRSWHGTNLRGSIRRVSPRQAAWRPGPSRHNIWELVVHAAYWKYAARRRLTGDARGSFPIKGSNWFERPAGGNTVRVTPASTDAWRSDVELLDRMHRALRDAVARQSARLLHQKSARSKDTPFSLIAGVAAHDLYHAGQIQLLKRLGPAR